MIWSILYTYSKSYKHYDFKQKFKKKKTLFNTKSNVIHIKKIGYVVFAHILKELHHNLLPKNKNKLIGYDNQYEFYLPWDLENQRTIKSWDSIFYEELIGDFEAMGKVTQKFSLGIHFLFS
jgi:hypothetical protein